MARVGVIVSGGLAVGLTLRFAELLAGGAPPKALLSAGGGACLLAAISLTLLRNSRQAVALEPDASSEDERAA